MSQDTERLVVALEARVADFERQMQRAERTATGSYDRMRRGSVSATRGMEQDMLRSTSVMNRALMTTQNQMAGLARMFTAGLFAGGAAGMVRSIRGIVSELSELGKVADRVGLTTDALQELRFGFELTGVAADQFDDNMQQFARRIGEAATRGGRLADILKANGVALRDANGNIRSSQSLLRDYANLVQNAASEQEKLVLATEAFGRGGADMVNALTGGANAIDDMADAARDAGGVIDEELIRKAEELDDRFAGMWRNFSINSKSAVMTAISAIDDLMAKATELGNHSIFRRLMMGMPTWGGADLTWMDPDAARAHGQPLGPDARIRDAFREGAENALSAADEELIKELQKRYGSTTQEAATTIIPGSGSGRGGGRSRAASAAAIDREALAVQRLIQNLEHELSLIGMSELERAKANALRQAGAGATEQQRQDIVRLVEDIHIARTAEQQFAEQIRQRQAAMDDLARSIGDTLGDAFTGVFSGAIKDFDDFMDHMTQGLARLAEDNIRRLFDFSSTGMWAPSANDNPNPAGEIGREVRKGALEGTQAGSLMGIFTALGMSEQMAGIAGTGISAGLGGFGLGYQSQSPLMGALGGAMSGFSAGAMIGGVGGPLGAVVGARAGRTGPILINERKAA